MRQFSLKKRLLHNTLLISLLAGVLGLILVSVSVLYTSGEMFDELLEGNAQALLGDGAVVYPDVEHGLQHVNEEMDIEYQVFDKEGRLLSKTYGAPQTPFLQSFNNDDYYNSYQLGRLWRIHTLYDTQLNRYVQIAQPWSQRIEYALPLVLNYVLVLMVFGVMVVVGNTWVIRQSLKPLNDLQHAIDKRHLQDLSPITPMVSLTETAPLVDAINELFERLKRANEAQERFTADASHELRTPLSAVQMKLQLIQRKYANHQFDDTQKMIEALGEVQADVKRATALVESLLTLARLDTAKTQTPFSPLSVSAWLEGVIQVVQPDFDKAKASLQYHATVQAAAAVVMADEQLLFVALRNLLDNALRYGGDGVVVSVEAQIVAGELVVCVKDNGTGVSQADRQRLTERFFRVLGSQKMGSGLGLSIVCKIIEHHQGRLWFEDGLTYQEGVGLGVFMALPLA